MAAIVPMAGITRSAALLPLVVANGESHHDRMHTDWTQQRAEDHWRALTRLATEERVAAKARVARPRFFVALRALVAARPPMAVDLRDGSPQEAPCVSVGG